jgi:hypothetical protein
MPAAVKAVSMTLGYVALALAFVALLTQLWRMGRPNAKPGKASLWVHRVAGYGAAGLFLLLLLGMGAKVSKFGGNFGARTAWHAAAGLALAALLFAKWAVVRPYRNLLKLAPALGVTVFALSFVVINLTSTVYLLGGAAAPKGAVPADKSTPPPAEKESQPALAEGAAADRALFAEKCGRCHHLARVFQEEQEPDAWPAIVRRMQGYKEGWISDAEAAAIATYLTGNSGPGPTPPAKP